jgi:hypothetical protein
MLRKLEPAVLIRGDLRNVYDKKVAKETLDKGYESVKMLKVVPRDWWEIFFLELRAKGRT